MADIVKMYGPGMSFYLLQTKGRVARTTITADEKPPSLERYSAASLALWSSNQNLETKMAKLRSSTIRLQLDLMKLQRHINTVQHELLPTWQADILSLLIEVMYARQRRDLPGGIVVGEYEELDYETLTRVYAAASKKIDRASLKRRLGLSVKYHTALQKYSEIVEFRSADPYQTECPFARWLVSEREKNPSMYMFWSKLFPFCYCRTAEESAVIF